jgi:replicative DNA helicase
MATKEDGELKLPPQNLEAEQAVLGAILMDPKALDRVMPLLPPNAFYKEAHNRLFATMLELQNVGEPVDTVTLTNKLTKDGLLEKVGGAYYVTGLVEALPSAANVEHYAAIVREKFVLREIISTGNELVTNVYDQEGDPNEILDLAEHRLFDLQTRAVKPKSYAIEPILADAYRRLDQRSAGDRKHAYSGIPSGFKDLDDMTDGFQPADLVILAGRPSMGKTALALNITRNAAMDFGHKIGFFSLEMSNYQLAMRLMTAEARVNANQMRKAALGKQEFSRIAEAVGSLSDLPVYIDDTASLDILDLRSRVRRFKADYDVELIMIDYMQLLSGYGKYDSRQQEISDISRSLKALAKELDITIVALSQLSRAVEVRGGAKRPILSDLRESGALEQDADVILFIYRPYVYDQKSEKKMNSNTEDFEKVQETREERENRIRAEIIVGKQRNGPTGTVPLRFFAEYTRFEAGIEFEISEPAHEDIPLD